MYLKDLISAGAGSLQPLYTERESRSIIYRLCKELFGTESYTHIVEPEYEINDGRKLAVFRESIGRLVRGEPLQYVLGKSEFCGRTFSVGPGVLIPRPETELLCRMLTAAFDGRRYPPVGGGSFHGLRILDLCTGSGCIAWTAAMDMPGAEVVAADISPEALKIAESQDFSEEITRSGAKRPSFMILDVLADCPGGLGQFDAVVSNPPYVRESEKTAMRKNVLDYEPASSLFVPDDDALVFYRAIARWADILLKPGGIAFVEINEALGSGTSGVFAERGFKNIAVLQDFAGKDRFVGFSK